MEALLKVTALSSPERSRSRSRRRKKYKERFRVEEAKETGKRCMGVGMGPVGQDAMKGPGWPIDEM